MNGGAEHVLPQGPRPKWFAAAVVLLAVAACLFVSPISGILPNVGLPFGYYGKLNKVKAQLRSLPNVQILGVRGNYDITLEDFTFDLRIDGKYAASLYFREAPTNPTWEVFGEADSLTLRRRRQGSFNTWTDAHDWWAFRLGPDNDLEKAVGSEIRNGHDVLEHFGSIMELIQTIPPVTLGEPILGRIFYLSMPSAHGM